MKRSEKKSVEKSHQESPDSSKQTSISKQQSAAFSSSSAKTQKQISKQESAVSGSGSTKTQKQMSKQESAASALKQESAASSSSSTKTQKQASKQESAASSSSSTKTQKQTSKQESTASSSGSNKTQKQTSKKESAASGSGSTKTSKTNVDTRSFERELTPITRTTELYRSNVRTAEPYRSNVCITEPYRRKLMPIIRKPYSSNWTRDVNGELQLTFGRIDKLNQQLDNANGKLHDLQLDIGQLQLKEKNTVRDSGDEMEVDEEGARVEMKTILKTFPIELELIYDKKFSSELNDEILRQIIPRLIEAMKPRYTPRYRQAKSWLAALHKHCRVHLLYKQRDTLDKDNCRLH
ncbi:hypothetical protein C1646_775846 [Rhizophagus diaphanus]|nr:hypothetical protein C1646_775846 [Rhizophagus diaphanus] [Rhizophagus sp. MUCL 43196]